MSIAFVAAAFFSVAPPAEAHTVVCGTSATGNIGSVYCAPSCSNHEKWRVDAQSSDSASYVQAYVDCAGQRSTGCAYYGFCIGRMLYYTTYHDDSGDCFAQQSRGANLAVQCYVEYYDGAQPVKSAPPPAPAAGCVADACLLSYWGELASRAAGVTTLSERATQFHVLALGDLALGYACTDGAAQCVPVTPACEVTPVGKACKL